MKVFWRECRLVVGTFSNEILLNECLHFVGHVKLGEMTNKRDVGSESVQCLGRQVVAEDLEKQ